MKRPAFYTASLAIGDCISATPTIRKLSEVYNSKVVVVSHHPHIFKNLPYVAEVRDLKDSSDSEKLKQEFDVYYSFGHIGGKVSLSDNRGIEIKHPLIDIRQYHAIDSGFTLLPEELHCDFVPDDVDLIKFNLPKSNYVCLHLSQNWPSRTWSRENWEELIFLLQKNGIPTIIIGKDDDQKIVEFLEKTLSADDRLLQELKGKSTIDVNSAGSINLLNETSLSESWEIINNASAVVTMDSGILHLAGTTETHIIQLGSSINPFYRAPYRKGGQDYRYSHIAGSCNLFCASNMRYYLRDWEFGYSGATPLQNIPLIDTCLENKTTFECHPGPQKVLQEIQRVLGSKEKLNIRQEHTQDIPQEKNEAYSTLIRIQSKSLGDQIGSLSAISEISKTKTVYVILVLHEDIFSRSYPNIKFLPYETEPKLNTSTGNWELSDLGLEFCEYKVLQYKFEKPLIQGYAEQLGVVSWERPKIDLHLKNRPIKSKYVCFSMHSTAQAKHWNYPGGWDQLCRMLRKVGLTPVCIDRFSGFGTDGWWNEVPSSCVKKQGLDLSEMTNYIHHSEFFVGISSGLSWVAHALGKPVVMISGVTSENNEFSEDTIRIMDKSVCHGCINQRSDWFDPSDWLWCPLHRNTERQFECTKVITPEHVFEEIKKNFL
jgi:autotransporter strand-loop-strand O-heptosyltransferase